jgi:alpha-1,6-mannosyltransferase
LIFTGAKRLFEGMRIVDVCAFYTPFGGGVRTYVDAKLKTAARFGHELVVLAPGTRAEVVERRPGAIVATIPSPALPVDRRYRYFDDELALHRALDEWNPDHVEASSPWSSATMVGRWQGAASRSLVMHADPLAAYAYRWLGGVASRQTIDRWFGWFWRHLRGLDCMFDLVVSANDDLTQRLRVGGLTKAETIRMGDEAGLFSPTRRSEALRRSLLASLGLEASDILLVGVGRFSAEKRWDMVIRAADFAARNVPIGLVLVGDGPRRPRLEAFAAGTRAARVLGPIDRAGLAELIASADALVHGCEAETFCMVAAEARASGVPLIVPDRGAARDQLVSGAGGQYRAASARSLARAIEQFALRGPELQRARAAQHSQVRTIDEHFEELFGRYVGLAGRAEVAPAFARVASDLSTAFVPAGRRFHPGVMQV